jgi:hypothetical protein
MRRLLGITAVLLCIAGASVGIAWAAAPHGAQPNSIVSSGDGTTHVLVYHPSGPGGSCDGDTCGSGGPLETFTLPAAHAQYSCTITVSLDYVTKGSAQFTVTGIMSLGKQQVAVIPSSRSIAAASSRDSRTLVFRPAILTGGKTYSLEVGVGVAAGGRTASINTSQELIDIEAVPVS